MALLTSMQMTIGGLAPAMTACAAGGDTFIPTDATFLYVHNADASPHTVTVITTETSFGLVVADIVVAIPATTFVMIGPLPPGLVATPMSGLGAITYSGVTSVTIAAIVL